MIVLASQRTLGSLMRRAIRFFRIGVVDGREVFPHIGLQDIRVTPGELLAAVHRGMGAFAFAAGVAVEDEGSLEDGLEDAGQSVMDDTIAERSGADLAWLSLVDRERAIWAWAVGHGRQLVLEPQQLGFQVEEEPSRAGLEPFAAAGLLGGTE